MEANETKSRKARRPARAKPRYRITTRDREILAWLARMRFARVEQIARRFGMGRTAAYRRVAAMRGANLVKLTPPIFAGPGVSVVTKRGLWVAQSQLGLPHVDTRQFDHDLELVEIATDYELEGHTVITDREIRSMARTAHPSDERYRVRGGAALNRSWVYPDLIVETEELRFAVELEIAAKSQRRLTDIIWGYLRSRELDHVVYLVTDPVVGRRIEKISRALTSFDDVRVRGYERRAL